MEKRERLAGLMFSVPAILFFGVFSLYPLINAFWISLFHYDMLTPSKFTGFQNYTDIFRDTVFLHSLVNTAYFVLATCIPILVFGLFFAVLLNSNIRLKTYYRTLLFLPVITSEVIASIVWMLIYNPQGPLNDLLASFGISPHDWLNDTHTAMLSAILMTFWYRLGYFVVLFLAGLQGIPQEYYEAARMDGAGSWRQFWSITFPLLKPTMAFASTISVIQGVTVFIPMMLLTNGGPGDSTTVVSLLIYQTGFTYLQMGKASAMSVVLFIGVLIVTAIQLRFVFKEEI